MKRRTIHLIPHVHWDREWYLTQSAFRARLVPMVDAVLELLESDPALRFHLDGQTVLVEDYLDVVPGARGTIEALVRRGQLGIGPWYVLADELHPSTASMRRNLDTGIRMARELGGEVPVLYSPDAFGHPAALPSLAAEFGIRWAVVWRGLGLVAGRDRDLVGWTGPDGRTMLTYHLPRSGYEIGAHLPTAGDRLEEAWDALREELYARSETPEVAVFVGADHHAPAPGLPGLARALSSVEPEAEVRFSSLSEFFTAVEAHRPRLEAVTGELRNSAGYAWSLQGVHASRSRLKRRHAVVERRLTLAGPLDRAAGEPGRHLRDHAWRLLLQSQFHDTLAGCCIDPVAAEQAVRLDGVAAIANEVARVAIDRLAGHDPDRAREPDAATRPVLAVWNPETRPWHGVVVFETTWFDRDVFVGPPSSREPAEGLGFRAFHLTGAVGESIPLQILRVTPGLERVDAARHYPDLDQVDRVWVAAWLGPLAPRAVSTFGVADGVQAVEHSPHPVTAGARQVGNGLVGITASRSGGPLVTSGPDRRFALSLETEPDHGDLYTPAVDPDRVRAAGFGAPRLLAVGPLLGALEWPWSVLPAGGGRIDGRIVTEVRAGESAVRLRIEFDNHARGQRLRLRFPAGAGEVDAGQLLSPVRRVSSQQDTAWPDEAVLPTAPATEYLAGSDAGAPWRLEACGTFEYELSAGGDVLLTLARSVGQLSRADGPARRGHAGWPSPTPDAEEPGRHVWDLLLRFGPPASDPLTRWIRRAALVHEQS